LVFLQIGSLRHCWLAGVPLSYWWFAVRGMESDVPSWSELRARHAALISKIDSEISSSRRETNRLRQQNALSRQQLERFDRAFVVLRRKLRAQTWQPLPPLVPISPSSSKKA
jgi:hypothetical protein